ncbi:hypothetical protein L9F63_018472, partial [Diploptera punctata]
VDLYPIKTIPGCISLQGDITTDKCRITIEKELSTWKADVVLNDGAPNVGKSSTNWLLDAFQQACLTLSALKLATHILRPGGWFVTKIFRSKDYQPLIWVFKQMFKKVHSTKPQASRIESAEIFVVCQGYKAPSKLDPRFLNPKYVFEELDTEPENKLRVYHPEKQKKAKAEGYPENDYTLYRKVPVKDFLAAENAVNILEVASEITFDDLEIASHPLTTSEIKECCKDIKVLGRKDLRSIVTWWRALKTELAEKKTEENEEKTAIEDEVKKEEETDEDDRDLDDLSNKISELKEEEARELKRKKKRTNKERKKLQDRLNLKMVLRGDEGPKLESDDMFQLKQIESKKELDKVMDNLPEILAESEPESDDELTIKKKFVSYEKDGNDHLDSSGLFYKSGELSDLEMEEESDDSQDISKGGLGKLFFVLLFIYLFIFSNAPGFSDSEYSDDENNSKNKSKQNVKLKQGDTHPLITDLDPRTKKQKKTHKAELWFEKDVFKNLDDDADEDYELDEMVENFKKKGGQIIGENKKNETGDEIHENSDDEDSGDSTFDSDSDDEKPQRKIKKVVGGKRKDGFEIIAKEEVYLLFQQRNEKVKLNEEGLALGTLMVTSHKIKRDLIDSGWNRYAFNDSNLPDWFIEDEAKHLRRPDPVPKEMVTEYKNKLRELNVRPIKKVIEAKARKKKRAIRRLDKAKKKVEAIMDNVDVSDREKARQIKQLYKKAKGNKKREVTYVVSKKHTTSKRARRPPGIKGPYRVVDPRMKKDNRKPKSQKGKKHGKAPQPQKDMRWT